MTKKLILCAIAGALAAQVWGMVSWMAIPWHFSEFKSFSNDRVVADALITETTDAGIYMVPNFGPEVHKEGPEMELFHTLMEEGPYAFMVVRPEGVKPNMPKMFAFGFLMNALMAGFIYWLLSMTMITDDKRKIMFIAMVGTLGAIHPIISHWNWWFFPFGYGLVNIIDLAVMWAVAGFAMVKLNKKLA